MTGVPPQRSGRAGAPSAALLHAAVRDGLLEAALEDAWGPMLPLAPLHPTSRALVERTAAVLAAGYGRDLRSLWRAGLCEQTLGRGLFFSARYGARLVDLLRRPAPSAAVGAAMRLRAVCVSPEQVPQLDGVRYCRDIGGLMRLFGWTWLLPPLELSRRG